MRVRTDGVCNTSALDVFTRGHGAGDVLQTEGVLGALEPLVVALGCREVIVEGRVIRLRIGTRVKQPLGDRWKDFRKVPNAGIHKSI